MTAEIFENAATYYDNTDFSAEAEQASESQQLSRTSVTSEQMDSFTVRPPVSVLERVRHLAKNRGTSTGAVLREIVENAVSDSVDDGASVAVADLRALIARTRAGTGG